MDHIFDQLDTLERSGRRDLPSRPQRSAYNLPVPPDHDYSPLDDNHIHEPLILDSFDRQLLRQPVTSSRLEQAALGRDRLTLPPARTVAEEQDTHYRPTFSNLRAAFDTHPRFEPSRYVNDPERYRCETPSSYDHHLPSSPALKASLRHPAPLALPPPVGPLHPTQAIAEESETRIPKRDAGRLQHPIVAPPTHFAGAAPRSIQNTHRKRAPPAIQGINLVSTQVLSDRFRSVFPFPVLNAVQSKCFDTVFNTNDNFVLSAPTGSGKTAVLELAICRLVNSSPNGSFKIVYQAPTKSLCSERQRDWQKKFAPLDLQCAELTGDTENSQLHSVQNANIIIATPEKWDSVTRKWKDHQKLMQMVKLFLIDEVHMLKEDRGATLEAVVSRMKSVQSDVRFVALSATVPNYQDIALWLGRNPTHGHLPAVREKFGEDFRPVRLEKHVCGYHSTSNDFAFDKTLNGKLPDVIERWSQRKPIMVFCCTRNACVETAKLLAEWWTSKQRAGQYWNSPKERIVVADKDLQGVISSSVAFHHAGLANDDRTAVENGYLQGNINVICCTSTLAVGVNLPCHMVIIKGTVAYQGNATGCKEYSDLEIMQMLGRAGRPQFDDTAVAVIMTRLPRVQHYEKMVSGQEILESCLHQNLIDHLNAEIGLGTITSVPSAKRWLTGTFLYVRLKENPDHYKIDGEGHRHNLDERLQTICNKALTLLAEYNLVSSSPSLKCTEFGDAMARYYIRFDTMKTILALPKQAKISEILSAISQASEFREVRFRAGEKNTYKDLNKNNSIKFPIPVNLDASAHKVSLVIQSVLGAVELSTEDYKQRLEYNTAKALVLQHACRLVRCIIDCQICREDSVATRNALMLARSLAAQVWDDSPLHMKQLESVGLVTVRKLVAAGINSIEELEATEAPRIERALTRNPPFGTELIRKARSFPKPQVSVRTAGEPTVHSEYVTIKLRTEITFMNDKVPEHFQRRPVYVCLLAETSDGKLLQFARISAKKLSRGQDILFEVNLTSPDQFIRVYVMCENLAGTSRYATLMPQRPRTFFPTPKPASEDSLPKPMNQPMATQKRKVALASTTALAKVEEDEFDDDYYINDADLALAEFDGFVDIEELDLTSTAAAPNSGPPKKKQKSDSCRHTNDNAAHDQLPNGKWACNHHCKDKTACKHPCCREGLDKKPKPPKPKTVLEDIGGNDPKQTKLKMRVAKKAPSASKASPFTQKSQQAAKDKAAGSKEASKLNRLHSGAKNSTSVVSTLRFTQTAKDHRNSFANRQRARPGFLKPSTALQDSHPTVYGDDIWDSDDLPDMASFVETHPTSRTQPVINEHCATNSDEEMLDAVEGGDEIWQQPDADQVDHDDDFLDLSWLANEEDFVDEETDGTMEDLFEDIDTEQLVQLGANEAAGDARRPFDEMNANSLEGRAMPTYENNKGQEPGDQNPSSPFIPLDDAIDSLWQARQPPLVKERTSDSPLHKAMVPADTASFQSAATEPKGADELEKWFHEYLGSDLFHYTG